MKKGKRESISKKMRFDVFKRDVFTCQYCGKTPPSVVLEIDHIHPVSKGGDNSIDNLITACFDCNRGKRDGLLSHAPQTVIEKAEIIAEREEQIKRFNKLLKNKRTREDRQINEIESVFLQEWTGRNFLTNLKESIRSNFIPFLTQDEMITAMIKACVKCSTAEESVRYFCGICWNMRRTNEGA